MSHPYAARICWAVVGAIFFTYAFVAGLDQNYIRLFGAVLGIFVAVLGYINAGLKEQRIFWQSKLIGAQKRDIERLIMELSRVERP